MVALCVAQPRSLDICKGGDKLMVWMLSINRSNAGPFTFQSDRTDRFEDPILWLIWDIESEPPDLALRLPVNRHASVLVLDQAFSRTKDESEA